MGGKGKGKGKDKDEDEDEDANQREERGWVRFIIIGEDKYNKLLIKVWDITNKIIKLEEKVKEKGMSKNIATEGNRLMKELHVLERQLELQQQVIEQKKDDELQQEKVEKRQRRKLKKEKDNNVIPKTQLAKKQRQENWKKAKKNHNVIGYMHYGGQATDQSNEIHSLTLWCYYDSHGNTTRMSNNPRAITERSTTTPVTIVPAKTSLKYINKRMRPRYKNWLSDRKFRKHYLKILEVIFEGDEKDYMFQEQQEAQAAEAEQWEKEKNEERQQQIQ